MNFQIPQGLLKRLQYKPKKVNATCEQKIQKANEARTQRLRKYEQQNVLKEIRYNETQERRENAEVNRLVLNLERQEAKQTAAATRVSEVIVQKIAKSQQMGSQKVAEAQERKKALENDNDYYYNIKWGSKQLRIP
eukprot:CAMPEP_0170489546 /NCGR_PEP_ID=MMETSP0208-20121228/7891_1 /TAXON_ID=197538 /ORGANISM="Strombidium inclinatum, Strain S3" /LENGTH=135 /DNA_ID=CAMNT_0010764525 /DNA_START=66 /DNA_END=473 /DNA_ORIENTATION=+